MSFISAHHRPCALSIHWCGVVVSMGTHHSSMGGWLSFEGGKVSNEEWRAVVEGEGRGREGKGVMEGGGRGKG